MTEYESKVHEFIQHFYQSGFGWDLKVEDENVFLLLEEFPYLELYDREWEDFYGIDTKKRSGHFYVRKIASVSTAHRFAYWKETAKMWEAQYDELYSRLEKLVEQY